MAGTGETTPTKASCLHAEIAPVLLNEDISSDLGVSEQAVRGLVDAHRFVDPILPIGMVVQQLPAGGLLDERQAIGRVAIDLVGAGKNEARVWAVLPRCLQKI